MKKPLLKQIGSITQLDFDHFPAWVLCHTTDYDKEWYDDTDEETIRPWLGDLPVGAEVFMCFVKAHFVLADRTTMNGFITLTPNNSEALSDDIASVQPVLFHSSGRQFRFWYGGGKVTKEELSCFYGLLGKGKKDVFPIRYYVDVKLTALEKKGEIVGFYSYAQGGSDTVVVTQ